MKPSLNPLKFEPIFKSMLWGGTRLRPLLRRTPSDELTGEAWLLSDVPGNESRVANGSLAGRGLREVMDLYGPELLGDVPRIKGRFPLLLKLIDARQALSVQVHPTDQQARSKHPDASGKTEAWVILDADAERSRIFAGFNAGVTAEAFRKAMSLGQAPGTLHQFVPQRGDTVFLPAGTVHAIGAEILLFEVQQTSDITYRLYDWDRVDAKSGMPRELHIDDGLACSDFSKGPCHPIRGDGELLVDCDYFRLERHHICKALDWKLTQSSCITMTVIEGSGTLGDEKMELGDTILLPATTPSVAIIPHDKLTILTCHPLKPRSEHADRSERRPR